MSYLEFWFYFVSLPLYSQVNAGIGKGRFVVVFVITEYR